MYHYSIEVLDNKSEVLTYTVPGLPIKATVATPEELPYVNVVNHWHHDLEFVLVRRGALQYFVDGVSCVLTEGQMIFVNSGRMHYTYPIEGEPCEFSCVVFHPTLLDHTLVKPFYDEIFREEAPAFLVLHPELPKEKQLMDLVSQLHRSSMEQEECHVLRIKASAYQMIIGLLELIRKVPDTNVKPDAKQLETMRRMTGYIQKSYPEKILLSDIAAAGYVSRSSCSSIFKRYLNKTPMEYLTEYRIARSCELLSVGELSITEIANRCGFCGSSYFTETFRKCMNCTPTEYRAFHIVK